MKLLKLFFIGLILFGCQSDRKKDDKIPPSGIDTTLVEPISKKQSDTITAKVYANDRF